MKKYLGLLSDLKLSLSKELYIILIIIGALLFYFHAKTKEYFQTDITIINDTENLKRPLVNLFTDKGDKLNVILVSKPFDSKDIDDKIIQHKNKGGIVLGITSYLEFPNKPSNPYENFDKYDPHKYLSQCDGWLHCFRHPANWFPGNTPLALLSESDYCDYNLFKPNKETEKIYDFIYICLKQTKEDKKENKKCTDWATYNKNWELAQKCIKIMCNKFKLKGLLVGREDCELPPGCQERMKTTEFLDHKTLKLAYQQSKFIFIPNHADASPRVITEAICTNIPVLMNKNILGGWKYCDENTGEFFTNETDISIALSKLLYKINDNKYNPRNTFIKKYGIINTGQFLKDFIYNNWNDKINIPRENVKYITIEHKKIDYM